MRRNRGFALLIVLWTLVLLAVIVASLTRLGRSDARIAANLTAAAQAEGVADGAVYSVLYALMDFGGPLPFPADGSAHELAETDGAATVRLLDEDTKLNPNFASPEAIAALMQRLGAPHDQARHLAAVLADWTHPGDTPSPGGAKTAQYAAAGKGYAPPGAPLESLDELDRLLDMPPPLAAALKAHMSLFSTKSGATEGLAVAMTTTQHFQGEQPAPALRTFTIIAQARSVKGGHYTRKAVIRTGAALPKGYLILEWGHL